MCLILVAIRPRPGSHVLLLANRDEFHARASAAAAPWGEDVRVLGGRDLVAGGSWLATRSDGRFAAVTNLRTGSPVSAPRSRGDLVRDYVLGGMPARAYLESVLPQLSQFAPFNLIVGDADAVFALDGTTRNIRQLGAGLHAIGNGPLDAEWSKARRLRMRAGDLLRADACDTDLLDLLRDPAQASDDELPDTGVGLERERLLSSIFIGGVQYGTRASTLLHIGSDAAIRCRERGFGPNAIVLGESAWHATPSSGWRPASGTTP